MEIIDTHAHIYAEEFDPDRQEMLARAKAAGVRQILMPNVDEETIVPMFRLADTFPEFCLPMMGLHPCSVTADFVEQLKGIEKHLHQRPYVAIGEIGIDLYWDKSTFDYQKEAFQIQCEWAVDMDLPVVIHSRESTSEIIRLLQQMSRVPAGVFHCFGGTPEEAQQILDLGMYLGIGGVLTFKNSTLSEVIRGVDSSRLLLETDAPYLAPVPYRGKRNEPGYLVHILHKLGDVLGQEPEALGALTSANARTLFKLAQ